MRGPAPHVRQPVAARVPAASANNILASIELIGGNGNANSDDSSHQNVAATGNQLASGIGISNAASMVVGDTIDNFQTVATR